ncbi:diguanylate cyclase [Thiomicrorhabdus sp. ZW0627]|nr:diguanylate cyclase [Thiomicrorhabdus sp. ZW0627]
MSFFIAFGIFILFSGISILFNYLSYTSQQQRLIQYISKEEINSFNSSTTALNINAQTIFSTVIFRDDIYKLMADAFHNPGKIRDLKRQELLTKLYPEYQILKTEKLRQLHFHFPGGESFLRFHRPELYGDNISHARYSIRLVNQTHEPVEGFEEGVIFNGYRHVYPIIYKGEFVGSVEISFSLDAIFNSIVHDHNEFYGLLLHKEVIENKVLSEEQRKNYKDSGILKDFLIDKAIQTQTQNSLFDNSKSEQNRIPQERLDELHAAVRMEMEQKFHNDCNNYSFIADLHGDNYLISLFPLKNIQNIRVGYIINYQAQPGLKILYANFLKNSLVIEVLLLIISVLMYFYLSHQIYRHRRLKKMARTDNLTGILNRAMFKRALKDSIKSSHGSRQPLSMIFFDIDHFKKINDTYGHLTGDKVLKKVVQTIQAGLHHTDVFARWGGEEFVILLPDTTIEQAEGVAERLRKKLENLSDFEFKITSSFGVSDLQPHDTADSFMHRVDELLYIAKERGRNCVAAMSSLSFAQID